MIPLVSEIRFSLDYKVDKLQERKKMILMSTEYPGIFWLFVDIVN